MKPRTTFTLLSQPPLLGSFLSIEGKNASSAKGSAKAMLKASIVTMGVQNSPCVLLIRTVPTMGPVQLKLTSTSVSARKNTPRRPFRLLPSSAFVVQDDGNVISNAPKKDAAKIMNITKKRMLGSQCVASQLKMSAVTVAPPSAHVRPIIMHIGTVYNRTMKMPYISALNLPAAGESDCFRKNDTVIGTIGNTQGVSNIRNPHSIASRINFQIEEFPSFAFPPAVILGLVPGTSTLNSYSSGIPHIFPRQAFQVTMPSTAAAPSTVRFCVRIYVPLTTVSPL